jgi:hypothetical protein
VSGRDSEIVASCNARPPYDHPWHRTFVACHFARGHEQSKIPHSWEIDTRQSWVAHFVGGPLEGTVDRVFVVGPVWAEIKLAPMPPETAVDWAIVGGTGIPDDDEATRWPGEVRYSLAEVVEAEDELIEWFAFYRYLVPSYMPPDRPSDRGRYWGD